MSHHLSALLALFLLGCGEASLPKEQKITTSAPSQPTTAILIKPPHPIISQPTTAIVVGASSIKSDDALALATQWLLVIQGKDRDALVEKIYFPFEMTYGNPWPSKLVETLCAYKTTAIDRATIGPIVRCLFDATGATSYVSRLGTKSQLKLVLPAPNESGQPSAFVFVTADFDGTDFRDSISITIKNTSSGLRVVAFSIKTSFIGEGPLPGIKF